VTEDAWEDRIMADQLASAARDFALDNERLQAENAALKLDLGTERDAHARTQHWLERFQGEVSAQTVRIVRLQQAVALLNSMILSGEDHSETSREAVRAALALPDPPAHDAQE
jgi:hypothetical protein